MDGHSVFHSGFQADVLPSKDPRVLLQEQMWVHHTHCPAQPLGTVSACQAAIGATSACRKAPTPLPQTISNTQSQWVS